jgi:hypothetical protein
MCVRTVDGLDIEIDPLRTVSGEAYFESRIISGILSTGGLQNLKPTTTVINGPAVGSYTPPAGCLYFEAYLLGGGGGGGSGGNTTFDNYGGGGGGGDIAYGIFSPDTYSYNIAGSAAGGVLSTDGTSGSNSTFDTLVAAGGLFGAFANLPDGIYQGRKRRSNTTVSLLEFGYCASQPPGPTVSYGGMDMFCGGYARALVTTANIDGEAGFFSGGAGGSSQGDGGAGGVGRLLIIEYY